VNLNLKVYKISADHFEPIDQWPDYFMGYKLVVYKPGFFSKPKYGSSFLRNFIWNCITYNGYTVLYLFDNDRIVHSKEITTKNFRVKYMGAYDIHHQQAFTDPMFRGLGISTNIHKLIGSYYKGKCDYFWVYHDILNAASERVVNKIGYEFVAFAKMNTRTKIVRLVDKL
jgi:RimJ/RimL family protein N-acetyltransferase